MGPPTQPVAPHVVNESVPVLKAQEQLLMISETPHMFLECSVTSLLCGCSSLHDFPLAATHLIDLNVYHVHVHMLA